MNLRQIEVFKAIMVTGSVSGAAQLLHVSAPAVSRTLAHTESQLGFLLFERHKGRLHPSAEARRLFLEVDPIDQGVRRIKQLSHELAQRRQDFISLVASSSIGQMLIPWALAYFRSGNPDVRVQFQCLSYEMLKQRLLDRQADIGVSIFPVDHPSLQTVPIACARVMCAVPSRHPLAERSSVAMAELLPFPFISYAHGTPFGAGVQHWFADFQEPLKVAIEVGQPQSACALVHAGVGIALVDEFSVLSWPGANFVAIPVVDAPPITADLVSLGSEPLAPLAQAFVRALRSVLLERGLAIPAHAPDPGPAPRMHQGGEHL